LELKLVFVIATFPNASTGAKTVFLIVVSAMLRLFCFSFPGDYAMLIAVWRPNAADEWTSP
jgi:hypothetical protein